MVGGGQLARMTQRAAIDLNVELTVLGHGPEEPAVRAGARLEPGPADDAAALARLAAAVDVVTLDHELVPRDHLGDLVAGGHPVRPSPDALRFAQDKLHARRELGRRGHPVPAFAPVAEVADVTRFADAHGWPVVAKAVSGGYDGRGVEVVHDADAAVAVLARGGDWLVEAHVPIACEVAVVAARRPGGELAVYPVVETVQRDGICTELVLPARVDAEVETAAVALARAVVEDVDAVGIVAVELFVTTAGELVLNELAVRPHNSGHITIEACTTSQFHNHLRAVLDWPLGDTALRVPAAATVNLLGSHDPADTGDLAGRLPRALEIPGASVHLYGKAVRPGRKIGHVTVCAGSTEQALDAAREAARRLVEP
jgi:5-(carboxyamino)imidazole ribonucleotide synthase